MNRAAALALRTALLLCMLLLELGQQTAQCAARPAKHEPALQEMPRKVLVLYDSRGGRGPDDNIVMQGFQMVFDHYGLIPFYRDVQQGLPGDEDMAGACAVVTTLAQDSLRTARPYLPWLLKQIRAGRRVMILGYLGVAATNDAEAAEVDQWSQQVFKELGVAQASLRGLDLRAFRYATKARGLADFERSLPRLPLVTTLLEPKERLKAYVSVSHPVRPGVEYVTVFVGPAGGFASENFIYWEEPAGDNRRKWYIDPFAFVEDSLAVNDRAVPDPGTLNGLRVAFSHVDADGFAGVSRVVPSSMCAEVLRDRIYKRFSFPVTLSLIVADVDPKIAGDSGRARKAQAVARELFAMPNIEPGSHTFSHPFFWNEQSKTRTRYENRFPYKIPGYTFNEATEIDGSMRFVSSLSPPDKPCRILQWSGDCRPTAQQVARVDALGMFNINGGDTMLDRRNDSLTSVSPMFRVVGGRYQIYTAAANENVLTNLWHGPFHGYRAIIETFRRTGSPRRLKPINIYYHFFSGEYPASVKALEEAYAWVQSQPVAPLFTSQYLEMVQGYLKARLHRHGPHVYHVEDYGRCLTLRLPADAPEPNLERSENVIGYKRSPEGLFVSLAPGAASAALSLEPGGKPRAYVNEATGFVSDFHREHGSLSLTYKGFGAGRIRIAGLAPGSSVLVQGNALARPETLKADEKGCLDVRGLRNGRLEVALP